MTNSNNHDSSFSAYAASDNGSWRQDEILAMIRTGAIAPSINSRLRSAKLGTVPWIATLTPAELRIIRSHGIRPLASLSATCWMQYGYSWTLGHSQGWNTALQRLRQEAVAAGANAVLDVKLRTIPLDIEDSMDFTLVGTAVAIEGFPPVNSPLVATLPALEFVKLLEANIVPTGIAIGAHFEWITDFGQAGNLNYLGNSEALVLSRVLKSARTMAYSDLRSNARGQGNGVLAHINFNQLFAVERGETKRYLARHIAVATTVDAGPEVAMHHDVEIVVDMHSGATPLVGSNPHHQSYAASEQEGAI